MAIKLTSKPNTDPAGAPWPYGKIRDDDGSGNGTELNAFAHQDIHQFFESMMAYSGVVANDSLDNQTNTFQFLEALQKAISKRMGARLAGNDLNNERFAGVYPIESGGGLLNGPTGFASSGQLIVTGTDNAVRQRVIDTSTGAEWTRDYDGTWPGGWSLFKLPEKVVEIGDWNMQADATKDVDIGMPHTKVRSLSVLIKSDANGYLAPINIPDQTSQLPAGSVGNVFGTEITLRRFAGERFDNSIFSSTSYNRGYIYVTYVF